MFKAKQKVFNDFVQSVPRSPRNVKAFKNTLIKFH